MFEDLRIKYIGAVDGHDIAAMERALAQAKAYPGPVIVHAITEKGRGYTPAERNGQDHFHAVGRIHPETGLPLEPERFGWTSVFADELVRLGRADPRIVALTAAMLEPVGLVPFAAEFPDRVFDVGIAEAHAATMAAGLAFGGLRPVVAVYASFLNRAFDQVLMDAGLHGAGVTFVLDRAGLTGNDGPSHNGQWDMALFRLVPGLRLAAPRDGEALRELLAQAVAVDDAPTVVRYPKGPLPAPIPALERIDGVDVIGRFGAGAPRVLFVAVGAEAACALRAAELCAQAGIASTVVDPRWALPVNDALVRLAAAHDAVATVEDGMVAGGVGEAVAAALSAHGLLMPVLNFGLPQRFLPHADREELAASVGLTPDAVAGAVKAALLVGEPSQPEPPASAAMPASAPGGESLSKGVRSVANERSDDRSDGD